MVDRPVIGQIARIDEVSQSKIEIIGELKAYEWNEFYECIKACAAPYGGRIAVRMVSYESKIEILKHLPKPPKKKP